MMPQTNCRSDAWPPHLTLDELSMMTRLVQEEGFASRTVFEVGTGGSTNVFAGQARFTWAVEHAPEFCGVMLGLEETSCNVRAGKLMYVCTPVVTQDKLRSWSTFADTDAVARGDYAQYVNVMDTLLGDPASRVGTGKGHDLPQPSVYYIDGRFRVACALKALTRILRMPPSDSKHEPYILLHDYVAGARGYLKLVDEMKFLRIAQQSGTLVKLVPVEGIKLEAVEAAFVHALRDQN